MYKIAICDDDEIYLEKIQEKANKYFNQKQIYTEIHTFQNGTDLLEDEVNFYDIFFLDINMEKINGIEIAKEIRKYNRRSIIIYISAFADYAILGYSVHAFQFLLKENLDETFEICMNDILEQLILEDKKLKFKSENGIMEVLLKNIEYIESFKRVVVLHTTTENHRYYEKISNLEIQITRYGFLRIQKSYLVNMNYIHYIKSGNVILLTGEKLSCSRVNYKEIIEKYLLWKGKTNA